MLLYAQATPSKEMRCFSCKRKGFMAVWLVALTWLLGQNAFAGDPAEYQIKAAFLYHFVKLVEWPVSPGVPLVIAIYGQDPFGNVLDQTLKGKAIDGHPLVVRRIQRVEELKNCQIVFVSSWEKKRLPAVLHAVQGKPVLTVGEFEGFLDSGGDITFASEPNRIRFDVNLGAASKAGLRISSRLLNLARIVRN